MADVVIRVDGVGKRYRIGGKHSLYKSFRETFTQRLRDPLARFSKPAAENTFWALQDVSFEVRRGEVIGIIGRNGAGKSTLLKILSRITDPTVGAVYLKGRVGALLEVGTGFHHELTGRENIYLSGAILGMTRAEISRKFDEIVAFAGVEQFIDTPVKRYSSGMGLRLGFAVAAHLEPEILVVDEVLAVGDAEFQKKCLGKMSAVAGEGRTVLFVSHNLNQVRRLCEKVVWLNHGQVTAIGETQLITAQYEASTRIQAEDLLQQTGKQGFRDWYVDGQPTSASNQVNDLRPVDIVFVLEVKTALSKGHHGLVLYDDEGRVAWSTAVDEIVMPAPGVYQLRYSFQSLPLKPGVYSWYMTFWDKLHEQILDEWHAEQPLIVGTPLYTHPMERFHGLLNQPATFALTVEPKVGEAL